MKNKVLIISSLLITLAFSACVEDKPSADFDYFVETSGKLSDANPETIVVGQRVIVRSKGKADKYVVWFGDAGHDYSKKDSVITNDSALSFVGRQQGAVLKEGNGCFESEPFLYGKGGSYEMVFVASNISNNGGGLAEATAKKMVKVIDTATTLQNFALTKYFDASGTDALLAVPAFRSADSLIISLPYSAKGKAVDLLIAAYAGNASITVGGTAVVNGVVRTPVTDAIVPVVVTSPDGNARNYKLAIRFSAPSKLCSLNTLKASNAILTFDQSTGEIYFELPYGAKSVSVTTAITGSRTNLGKSSSGTIKLAPLSPTQITVYAQDTNVTKSYQIVESKFKYQDAKIDSVIFTGLDKVWTKKTVISGKKDTVSYALVVGNVVDLKTIEPNFKVKSLTKVTDSDKKAIIAGSKVDFSSQSSKVFYSVNGTDTVVCKISVTK